MALNPSILSMSGRLLKELACQGATERLEIVVDTVAGTSAGGISGAALAKAIVDGGDMRELCETWIERPASRSSRFGHRGGLEVAIACF